MVGGQELPQVVSSVNASRAYAGEIRVGGRAMYTEAPARTVRPLSHMTFGEYGGSAGSEKVEQRLRGSLDARLLRLRRKLPDYGTNIPEVIVEIYGPSERPDGSRAAAFASAPSREHQLAHGYLGRRAVARASSPWATSVMLLRSSATFVTSPPAGGLAV